MCFQDRNIWHSFDERIAKLNPKLMKLAFF